ncbi:beta-L-arabinofuranosidase domain-containing protein [Cohnella sp. GCM10020058]|uniref:beta-L-arabinofuranosidase domain-containing protein n=1 Tax=Cohnella sp. GCM10020058 TaxID=3317330 RepID=UPI003632FB9C
MNPSRLPLSAVRARLLPGPLAKRSSLNTDYVMSLSNDNLLRSFYLEAGLWSYSGNGGTTTASATSMDGPEQWHWGWEAPTCELRGHIMGHWLSAAARIYAQTGDRLVKAKADTIVDELARCQDQNGGGWLAAFPEKFMHRASQGKWVWAPHYTIHKLLMGLYEMHVLAGNERALAVMIGIAAWFHRWSAAFSREEMDDLLDLETGGMLEVWSDLYGITGDPAHLALIRRYDRRRLFDALIEGRDVLTNRHANTQIPEILGAARAWEVTGDERYRMAVHAFWELAVVRRGYVCTGAGDNAELWMPPEGMAARLGVGQEHCSAYNMMRLAHCLLRWTGDPKYADYWERRFYNGVLAQQHGRTGMIAYFLGVAAGSRKTWGTPTQHFWCCHGTLMQANASYEQQIYMTHSDGIAVCQWLPSETSFKLEDTTIGLELTQDGQFGAYPLNEWSVEGMKAITDVHVPPIPASRPQRFVYELKIGIETPGTFAIKLRLPWWLAAAPRIAVNGAAESAPFAPSTFVEIRRQWSDGDTIRIELPTALKAEPLPGDTGMYAFMDGPVALAGLVGEESRLSGDPLDLASLLKPDDERHHGWWNVGRYRTVGQDRRIRFIPLYEVTDELYTVYFPVAAPT